MKFCLFCLFSFLITSAGFASPADIFKSPGTWTDEKSQVVNLSQWRDKMAVVSMAYTTCKRTCPFQTLDTMKKIEAFFNAKKIPADFFIVSYDPESETPKDWALYKKKYGYDRDDWHFLIGEKHQTRSFAQDLGLGDYWVMDDHVIHGFRVLVYNKGQLLKVFDSTHYADDKSMEELLPKQ